MRCFLLFLSMIFVGVAPALAQTAEERRQLDWAERRGRLLFEIDRAAWVTTDDLQRLMPDPEAAGIRGWTVEPEGGGYNVVYFMGEGEARAVAYRARVENNRVVRSEVIPAGIRPALTALQRRLADGRRIVFQAPLRACGQSGPNVAAIPPETPDGPMDIYVLTQQTQASIYPMGGHNRVTVSAAGEILSHRAFTNSCVELTDQAPEQGARTTALMVTHVLDPIPTEIHVFMSIWVGLPVYVSTAPRRVWRVDRDRIGLVEQTGRQR